MAEFAWSKGWRNASLATDTVIVYFHDVVKAFKARFTQLGGKIVAEESYQSLGSTNVTERRHAAERAQGRRDRDIDGGRVRRSPAAGLGAAHAREQHAGAELMGR